MDTTSPHAERFRERAAASLRDQRALAARLAERVDEAPRPGDVYDLPPVSSGVEWAVLEAVDGRLLVVPADAHPLLGRHDLPLAPDAPCGEIHLRCGLARWIGEAALKGARRTGLLDDADVREARRLAGRPDAPLMDDEDPEYEGWLDGEVRTAVEALRQRDRMPAAERPAALRAPRPHRFRTLALAATIALGTFGFSVWWSSRQDDATVAGLANLPLHELRFKERPRGGEEIRVREDVSHFVLIVPLRGLSTAGEFALTFTDESGVTRFDQGGLVPIQGELVLLVPRSSVGDSEYVLELWSVEGAVRTPVARRRVLVVSSPPAP